MIRFIKSIKIENFPLEPGYKTDWTVIKSNTYSSHLNHIVTLQIIELYEK